MAVNIISSGFLLLVLAAGVQSALKDLGESCTDGTDTCVHPLNELVCDTPTTGGVGVCRLKSGEACDDDGGLCVNGALCEADACTCKTGYTAAATGKCTATAGKWGATCAAAADCTATNAGVCTAGACVCTDETFSVNYADGSCAAVAAADKVGTVCTSGGSECTSTSGTHLSCPATAPLKCKCDAGYYAKQWGGTCVANTATTVGKACTPATAVECTGSVNEECPAATSKCTCKAGHTSAPGGVCYAVKGTLKGGCSVDADCGSDFKCTAVTPELKTCKTVLAAGAPCTANSYVSLCGDGLVCDGTCKTEVDVGGDCTDTTTKKCKLHTTCTSNKCVVDATYIGGSCTAASANPFIQGTCQSGTLCGATASGICVCPPGYEADPAEDCAIIAHRLGAPCTATTANTKADCGDDSLVCSAATSGTCGCATAAGYTEAGSNGGVCSKPPSPNSLGGACTTTSCTDPNAICSGLICTCKPGYTNSYFTGQCVVKADATTVCTGLTCVEGSTCDATSHFCTCDTGMAPSNGYCLPTTAGVLGGPCTITATASTAQGTCTAANSICPSGTCMCEDNYTATALAGSCRSNDAMMITTSSLLITLAAVISQLFVR